MDARLLKNIGRTFYGIKEQFKEKSKGKKVILPYFFNNNQFVYSRYYYNEFR